ncbi:MAG: DMT family transporter [Acidimicrobiia bacterium]
MSGIGYEAAALAAGFSWAIGGLIATGPSRELGGPRFTRLRMYWVAFALVVIATAVGGWDTIGRRDLLLLGSSGIIGLAIGDAALFSAFARLGPRRTSILFTTNAPMTAVASAVLFGERFDGRSITGAVAVLIGVGLAIAFGTRPGQKHGWEQVQGPLIVGIGFGLLGAAGQSIGVLLADPVFEGPDEVSPWAAAAVRAVLGLAALVGFRRWFENRSTIPYPNSFSWRLIGMIILSGTIAMVLGKTLVLIALDGGDPGIVSVLVSTTPALQLPLIWAVTRERPPLAAWAGAGLAAAGTALIVA